MTVRCNCGWLQVKDGGLEVFSESRRVEAIEIRVGKMFHAYEEHYFEVDKFLSKVQADMDVIEEAWSSLK